MIDNAVLVRISYGPGVLGRARNGAAVQQHLLHDHLTGILHAERDHGKTVTDQYYIHAGMVGDVCTWEVVGGDHGDWFVLSVEALQCVDGDRLSGSLRGCAQRRM